MCKHCQTRHRISNSRWCTRLVADYTTILKYVLSPSSSTCNNQCRCSNITVRCRISQDLQNLLPCIYLPLIAERTPVIVAAVPAVKNDVLLPAHTSLSAGWLITVGLLFTNSIYQLPEIAGRCTCTCHSHSGYARL